MKRSTLALALALAAPVLPGVAHAELSFNIGAVSDYRFRGISQTRVKPAIQGGVDYTMGSFYVGAWASNIKWIKDSGGDAGYEVDLYGGITGEVTKGVEYDIGVLTYQYPSNKLDPSANTTEIYGALTFSGVTVKYSHAVTNTFGWSDSKNSFYLEASTDIEVGSFTITPHIGHQKIKGPFSKDSTYTDYSLTVATEVGGVGLSLAVVGTDADKATYSSPVNGKKLGKTGLVLGASYSF